MTATLTSDGELTYASFPIEKVEETPDGNVVVWGKATDDSVDSDEQIVDPKFAAKAIDDFFVTGPNIRVQHQAQRDPAGVGLSYERDGDAHWVKSLIVEPVAQRLVKCGALRAYSVGIARPTIQRDSVARGGRITDGQIVEISLVDRPANKNCGIQLVKADKKGRPSWVGKVFGADDFIAKALSGAAPEDEVTLTLPADVQMSFSPLDMAKIVARKHQNGNGLLTKDVTTVHGGGVPAASMPKMPMRYEGGVPTPHSSMAEDGAGEDEGGEEKGKLSTEARDALPDSDFALPGREYPIHDRNHAENALARVSEYGTPEEKAKVRAAVARRYPGMGKKGKKAAGKAAAKAALAVANEATPDMTKPKAEKKDKAACMSCGAMQNDKHAFCSECGENMAGAMPVEKNHDFMCTNCGYELDKGEKFCPSCGKDNPGHNPMADLKIPANKGEGTSVTDATETAVAPPEPVVKAKKPGKKGKGTPFGGNQAPAFGKDKDDDAKPDGDGKGGGKKAKKVNDAPVTRPKSEKGKKFGHTASPGDGVTGQDGIDTVPAHREPDGLDVEEFERDAGLPTNKSKKRKRAKDIPTGKTPASTVSGGEDAHPVPGHRAAAEDQVFDRDMSAKFWSDPAGTTQVRLKTIGTDTATGFTHDLVCPAYSWSQVEKAYPLGLGNLNADDWQQKSLLAAASAPLDQALAASKLGQHAFTIKSAALTDVIDIKNDLYKAFRDANPGPGSFPTPGHICATSFQRPAITTDRASYSHQYSGPNNGPHPTEGGIAASGFTRGPIAAEANMSPANKSGAPYPSETGVHRNLDYSSVAKENVAQAFTAMHDHFDRVFPGVCPMNTDVTSGPARQLDAVKSGGEPDIEKKVSADGMTKKQRAKLKAKLTKKVMKGKMPLDQARIRMGKKPKTSPAPLEPQKAAQPDVTKTVGDSDTIKAFSVALKKARKEDGKKIAALTKAVNQLAGQPDPGTQAFKGMALQHPMLRKTAGPVGVAEIADNAVRTQAMLLAQMEQQARNSTDPAQRESAWQYVVNAKGLTPTS